MGNEHTVEITYREAIAQAIMEEMERDPKVILLGEDVGKFGGAMAATKGVFDRFGPRRVIDTPISEIAIVGAGLGAALTGLRPVAEIMFVDFTACCMDQIINQVAKVRYMLGGHVRVPLVIRTQGGGGKSYAAQHSQSLESLFCHVPGLRVVMPATPATAKGLLKTAIRCDDPVIFIEHKLLYADKEMIPIEQETLPLGKARVVRRGTNVTVVSYSRQLQHALQAAEELAGEGIDSEVIDLCTLSPLDMPALLQSLNKTGRMVIVEEGCRSFGIGAEISARVMEEGFDLLDTPVLRIGALDTPMPFSPILEQAVVPDTPKVVSGIRSLFAR